MIAAGARQKPEPASQSTTIGEWAVSAGRWQDHLGLLLGVRAALSPIAFRFTHDVAAAVGAIAGGRVAALRFLAERTPGRAAGRTVRPLIND